MLVNEIFHSIQGEGRRSGEATTFIRLAGCNLRCAFCDTNFDSANQMSEEEVVDRCVQFYIPWVCLTGGEPLIQDVRRLVYKLHEEEFMVSLETNGTQPIPDVFDHIVVSPKRGTVLHHSAYLLADEWKYIIEDESDFERIDQKRDVALQPVDCDLEIAKLCVDHIMEHPGWRLSLQIHKLIGVR